MYSTERKMIKAEEALEGIRREGRESRATLRRMDPIARYRHLMDGIDGPFPDQEAIRRSLRPQDNTVDLAPFHHRPRLGMFLGSPGGAGGSNSDSDQDQDWSRSTPGGAESPLTSPSTSMGPGRSPTDLRRRRYLNRISRIRSQVRY